MFLYLFICLYMLCLYNFVALPSIYCNTWSFIWATNLRKKLCHSCFPSVSLLPLIHVTKHIVYVGVRAKGPARPERLCCGSVCIFSHVAQSCWYWWFTCTSPKELGKSLHLSSLSATCMSKVSPTSLLITVFISVRVKELKVLIDL